MRSAAGPGEKNMRKAGRKGSVTVEKVIWTAATAVILAAGTAYIVGQVNGAKAKAEGYASGLSIADGTAGGSQNGGTSSEADSVYSPDDDQNSEFAFDDYDSTLLTCTLTRARADLKTDVVIPSHVMHEGKTYAVTKASDSGPFYIDNGDIVESITFPDTFSSLNPWTIQFTPYYSPASSGVNGLTTVNLGKGISSVCGVCSKCKTLKNIVIPDDNPSLMTDGKAVFSKDGTVIYGLATGLTSYTVPEAVREVGCGAFQYSCITDGLAFPESGVRKFDQDCTQYSDITSIKIPRTATTIEDFAFECTYSLSSFDYFAPFESTLTIGDDAFMEGGWQFEGIKGDVYLPHSFTWCSLSFEEDRYATFHYDGTKAEFAALYQACRGGTWDGTAANAFGYSTMTLVCSDWSSAS